VAFLNTMVNGLLDLHAVERDSWQACCSRCVPTVLATPDAAPPPACTYLRASMLLLPMSMTSTPFVCLFVCLFIAVTFGVRMLREGGHLPDQVLGMGRPERHTVLLRAGRRCCCRCASGRRRLRISVRQTVIPTAEFPSVFSVICQMLRQCHASFHIPSNHHFTYHHTILVPDVIKHNTQKLLPPQCNYVIHRCRLHL
jgi:hypothetical protein